MKKTYIIKHMIEMKKTYIIKHIYDVDGGFGDAIEREDVIGVVECTEEEIEAFLNKYSNPVVYDEPYAYLVCHQISAVPINLTTLEEIAKDPYGDNGYYERQIEYFKNRDPERFKRCNDLLEDLKED